MMIAVPLFVIGFPLYLGVPALQQYISMKPRSYVPPGWVRTSGIVVSNQRHGSKFYYWDPVVTFQDRNGTPVEFVANSDTNSAVPKGTLVSVAYAPQDPHRAEYINEPGSPKTTSLVLGIFGTAFGCLMAGLVIWFFIYLRRDDKRHKAANPS